MSSKLTRDDVLRIAVLARLELSEAEVALFTRQLDHILEYVEQLRDVDTTGVSPTSHALAIDGGWRADEPEPSLPLSDTLANAPSGDSDRGLFKVPRVL
jgi:aspartyl-tRNA(Asn)/glutamyl-tRNA(Gln) amidotransferase subunit C